MKTFCFTVDDNIRCLKELTGSEYVSIFEHPYLRVYKALHNKYNLKVQLNLFYEEGAFNLSKMTDRFFNEWLENSDWLKLSFHSRLENERPYEHSGYDEVYTDCKRVNEEIVRFASCEALANTTTLHFCRATEEGICALYACGVRGLLGLYGTQENPRSSYQSTDEDDEAIRRGEAVVRGGITYSGIDVVLNLYSKEEILSRLEALSERECIRIMIHEQYFYPDYPRYQSDFEEKLDAAFAFLTKLGYKSTFFEDGISIV